PVRVFLVHGLGLDLETTSVFEALDDLAPTLREHGRDLRLDGPGEDADQDEEVHDGALDLDVRDEVAEGQGAVIGVAVFRERGGGRREEHEGDEGGDDAHQWTSRSRSFEAIWVARL